MCGIVAMLSERRNVSPEALGLSTARISHRGPEVRRYWVAPHHRVGLGHARLSIVDLTSGNQPLSSEDDQIHAVVNGEFYNFKAIRRNLEHQGHKFKTGSDSEILIHLYEQYGTNCLRYLRGEFAFVLWDERNRRLFAARDRFGVKPLFYATHNQTLYLASEVKALFAAGIPARWDHESFYQSIHFVMSQYRTLYRGVLQIPAGYFLLASESNLQLHRYWDINFSIDNTDCKKTDADYAAEVSESVNEAVKIRMEADVPVGCYLSGGLDSSAILGIASKYSDRPVPAFALSFDHQVYDEGAIARRTAQSLGANFTEIPVNDADLADNFSAAITQSETTALNSNGVAKYLLSRAVQRSGLKVVLTGEGADEVFGGYPHFKRDNLLYGGSPDANDSRAALGRLQESNPVYKGLEIKATDPALDCVRQLLGFAPSQWECTTKISATIRSLFSNQFCAEFKMQSPYRQFFNEIDVDGQLSGRHPVHQSMYLWSKTWLPNYILSFLGDRMEMAHSVEGRLPFLDHVLVERVSRIPVNQKIRGMNEKFVLREAVRPYITKEIYNREKHPFAAPPALLRNGPMKTFVYDTLNSETFKTLPFFNSTKALNLLEEYAASDSQTQCELDPVLMVLTSSTILQKSFGL